MRLISFLLLLNLTSCASYVKNFHRQIDQEQRANSGQPRQRQNSNYGADRRPINNPVTLNGPSADSIRNMDPRFQRQYTEGDRRARSSDFVDNDSDGSLWSGKETGNFLFVTNNLKRRGDIVIVEVMNELKDKIQEELKRNYPERAAPKAKAPAAEEKPAEAPAENIADQNSNDPNKIHDKISTSVVEVLNQDYLMLRGRKEVMYQKVKRYFEFQAVVSQKDISSNDTVRSNKILEPRINVLRY